MKYFLDYVLGYRSQANLAAEKGSVVHKGLEMLASIKLAQQNKEKFITNGELGKFYLSELTPDLCIELAYDYYSKKSTMYNWQEIDLWDCKKWFKVALEYNNGMFNPMNQSIVSPETYFDFEINKPWAKYEYKLPDGKLLKGTLAIKGTMDLMVDLGNDIYEMVDYKTGKRKDFNTGEEKTYDKLCSDSQLRMYYYAARHIFPNVKQIIVTIFYINDGGPISMCYDDDDLEKTEKMLEKRFNLIRNTFRPKKKYPHWSCTNKKICYFGTHDLDNNEIIKEEYKEKSICQNIGKELLTLGMDRVMIKRAKSSFDAYGYGAGRANEGK